MKTRYWLFSILILLVSCSYLFYSFYEAERLRKIDEVYEHQKIHGIQAARSFHEVFEKYNSVLFYLSKSTDVILMNNRGKNELDLLLGVFENEIKGITRVNNKGEIIYTTPYYPNSIGADISKQDHVAKILKDHKPIVSEVFTAVQGYQAIVIHHPVFKDGVFDGSIAFSLNFQLIAKYILDEIKIGKSGYAWMISSNGTELYCSIPGHVGKSIFENAAEFPELISLSKKMIAGLEGSATYVYDKPGSGEGAVHKIAHYLPVKINGSFWSIAITYTRDEITASLVSFRNKLIFIFSLVFLGGLLLSFFGVKAWVILKETEARRYAEINLLESEKRFEQLIKGLPQLIWTATPEGLFDFFSPQWVEFTGIQEKEQLGDNWLEQIHPHDQTQLLDTWNYSLSTGYDFMAEFRIRRNDGVYHWFDTRALPMRDANGKIVKWFGSSTDVQKERDMREALQENEERYRLISTAASDYMFYSSLEKDGTLKHRWVAGAFESITGYTFKEYVERGGWATALHPDDHEQDIKDMLTLKSNKPCISEIRTITKSGKTVWVRVYASPVWDDKTNTLKGITGAVQDITERKVSEQELKKLYTAIEQSPAAIVITDIYGKIEYVNAMFSKTTGFSPEEIKGEFLMILKPDKNFKDLNTQVWNTISNGKEWRGEYFNEKKDGSFYWESTLISPIKDGKGIITNYLAVQEDVTEKKITLNELVLAKEKAEEAIKVKNVFLANMSHELRTPLIGILGYSEMLTAELKQLDLLEMAMGIRRSGNRLLNTLNLILDLTRIESDKFELNVKTTNLKNEIEFVYHIFYGAALEKKINFSMQFIDRRLYAKVDDRIFKIILENIINNAIKFTNKGSITIIAGIEKNETVYIEIKDTGIGIAKEHQDIIFEEFRQVSEGISRDYQGTGLGLSITKKYVEILGGNITVTSELGMGSSFILRFPFVNEIETSIEDEE